jgi:subtilisin family serine protease
MRKIKFIAIALFAGLLLGSIPISENVYADEKIGKLFTDSEQLPPVSPPGLEKENMQRVISFTTSEKDISEIKQKGCTVIHKLNQGTSFFCPTGIVDTLDNVRPVKVYHPHDLYQDQQIQADRVWNEIGFDGSGVTVAILDTGVQSTHDELTDSIFATRDFTGEGGDYLDYNGHGTHVSGIISGNGVHNLSSTSNKATGVAPGASLIVGKVCANNGCPEDAILAGISWAQAQGAEIINMSLGGGLSFENDCDNDGDSIVNAVNFAAANGVVVVISSGNDGNKQAVSYPGCASGAIAVGAVNGNDVVASFSNAGPALDIVAPGVDTLSSWSCYDIDAFLDCGSSWYYYASGTSMSSPHVAGVVALMLDKNPGLSVNQVKEALYSTAIPIGQFDGNGRVDAYAAVNYQSGPFVDDVPPTITGNPISSSYEITLTDQYDEFCTATDNDPTYNGNCVVKSGGIDTSVLNYQSVTYTADPDPTGNIPADVVVSSTIVDTTSPTITLIGPSSLTLTLGDTYVEQGATVSDNNKGTSPVANIGGEEVQPNVLGTYIVEYTAVDPSGNSASSSRTVNVVSSPSSMHVGDLNWQTSGKKNWNAKVTITIHDDNEDPLSGVLVQGVWDNTTSADCTTDDLGMCQVNQSTKDSQLIFSVESLIATGFEYTSIDDHDPEEDFVGEPVITITQGSTSGGSSGGSSGGGGPNCDAKPNHPKCQ